MHLNQIRKEVMAMIKYSDQVFGYVPKEMKTRLRRIKAADRDKSESYLIQVGLAKILPEVEKELGISEPVQKPRSHKKAV